MTDKKSRTFENIKIQRTKDHLTITVYHLTPRKPDPADILHIPILMGVACGLSFFIYFFSLPTYDENVPLAYQTCFFLGLFLSLVLARPYFLAPKLRGTELFISPTFIQVTTPD